MKPGTVRPLSSDQPQVMNLSQVTRSGEVQTDSTGWATVHFQPLRALPMRAGARVNFFVRARKAGENPLAGVSTRRLVSVGVHPAR